MRRASLLLIAGLCGCAGSSSSSSPQPASQTVRILGPGGSSGPTLNITRTESPNVQTFAFAPDQVWRLLPGVLDSLGIPVGTLEPSKRTIGNSGLKVRSRLKAVPLSRYIDCGSSTQIGPNADNYDVVLTMLVHVQPGEAGSSTVTTNFDAVARPVNFAQDYSQCSSKGLLERRVFEILNARLQR
jgi:hypothetical protein